MKNLLVLTVLIAIFNLCFGDHNQSEFLPYFSPGLQIGYGDSSFFVSIQITAGILPREFPAFPGATIGKRFYRKNKFWDNYKYYDVQCSITPLAGFGFGKLYNNQHAYYKYKIWGGLFGLISYDYLQPIEKSQPNLNTKFDPNTGKLLQPNLKHNFGLFGVMPIFDINQM